MKGQMGKRDNATKNLDHNRKAGWLARRTMAFRLVLTTLVVTVLVMGAMTAVMTWRQQTDAVHTVQRDMDGALTGVDQSLQLVYAGATERVLKIGRASCRERVCQYV